MSKLFSQFWVRHDFWNKRKHADLRKLSLIRRLLHKKTWPYTWRAGVGFLIMMIGCAIASCAQYVPHDIPFGHILTDMFGYLIHAIGAIPFIKFVEPVLAVATISE